MKKPMLFILYLIAVMHIYAQDAVILRFENHAIKSESDNSMKLCKYVDPMEGGEDRIWDFSGIESTDDFTGFVKSSYHSVNSRIFPRANTELDEFNNRFYYRIEDNRIEQVGYSSQDNLVVTEFDKPLIKMIYPFSMGDHFEGTFNGSYKMGTRSSVIQGNYVVIADGTGMLMLPDNFIVDNTLRVRSMKNYKYEMNGFDHFFEIVTYRWYCEWHRYPLLVLTQIKSIVDEHTSVAFQAAYNNDVSLPANPIDSEIHTNLSFDVFPNPADRSLSINYNVTTDGDVRFGLFNLSGEEIRVIYDQEMAKGTYHLEVDLQDEGLPEGTYLLKAEIAGMTQSQKVVLVK
jgi:hypothetical protein